MTSSIPPADAAPTPAADGVPAAGGAHRAIPAVAAWHALFDGAAGERLAADTQQALDAQLRRRGLVFGETAATERALCTVLRPRLVTLAQWRALAARSAALLAAFRRAHEATIADPALRAQLRLEAWEESLLGVDPRGVVASPTSRLDAFVVDGAGDGSARDLGIWLTEYNGETPAGAAFTDSLSDAFLELPAMRAFARDWIALPIPARHGVTASLLDAWTRWAGRAAPLPRVAILDWDDVPTRHEFVLFRDHFRTLGIDCVIGDPAACEYRNGALWLGEGRIDLIYKRVLLHELVERAGLDSAVLRAWRDGAVCMVNPPPAKLMHKKASLALLGDERNAALFDGAMHAAIRASVPWTRVVEERWTERDGRRVDLVPHLIAAREQLVLKPNDDYGGAGIVLGWTVDDAAWARAVERALAVPYVVQARVPIPYEPYAGLVDGRVALVDRMIDTAPFCSHGAVADGVLTRLSTAALLNVTAGGGSTVPTFVVEPR